MPRIVALSLALLGACDSTALSLGEPNEVNVTFVPAFLPGDVDVLDDVEMTFTDAQVDNLEGDPARWFVLDWDFGDGLILQSWTFETNFRLRLSLRRSPEATAGFHEMTVRVQNNFGTFLARGRFLVDPAQ